MSDFGKRLKAERRTRRWDIPELSKRSGLPRATLYHLEMYGKRPRDLTVWALADALGLPPEEVEGWLTDDEVSAA